MFIKKEKLGYKPIQYKRGKRSKQEYKSKCLEYSFQIPQSCVLTPDEELDRDSTPENIKDLFCLMPSGANVSVSFLPMDGSLKDINIDRLGSSMVEGTKRNYTDRLATYYGTVEFLEKPCAHSVIEMDKNGIHCFSEFYAYFAPYCQILFAFTYTYETMGDFAVLKQAFRACN